MIKERIAKSLNEISNIYNDKAFLAFLYTFVYNHVSMFIVTYTNVAMVF